MKGAASMTDMEKRLQEIEARAEAATPGPWESGEREIRESFRGKAVAFANSVSDTWDQYQARKNARFIAHSREDTDWLVAGFRESQAEVARLRIRQGSKILRQTRRALARARIESSEHD